MNLRIHFFVMAVAAGFALFCPGAVAGPHFDQVGLLLPFDGTHGATSTTDVSKSAHSPAFHGNAKISAGRSKFGGTSCYFDGMGDYLTVPDSEDWNFGTGDFTIEFWVLRTGVSKFEGILGVNAASWNSGAPVIVIYNKKILITEGEFANKTQASTSFIANTWYHVAFSRGGGFMRLFVNGKLEGFAVDNHSYDFNEMRIGRYNVEADYDFGGYLDDLRITKGVARYPSNFALPEAMKGDAVPTITLLTESMTVAEGGSVNLSVTAVGALPLAYQWSKGGVEMSGATQSTLTLSGVALADAGDYRVAVSNSLGTVDSETITVTVLKPAGIDVQPEGGSAILGGDFTLKVVASGTEPISYQWHHKGATIDGETKSTLSLTNLRAADMGSYHVVVSNEGGEETSNSVSLSMLPTITKLTESMTPVKGEDVELSVTAAGTAPLTYQWYHSGTLIEGATSTTLFLTDFQTGDSGDYYVVVSNAAGSVTSDMVALSVPPTITRFNDEVSVIEGDTLKLSVAAVGTPPIIYQWSKDGEEIPGAIAPDLTLVKAEPSHAGNYTVEVQNGSGRIGPFKVTVTVLQPAKIVTQPVGGRANFGEVFAFEVVAEGTEPITYEWYQGGALLGESTGSSLSLADLVELDSGEYHVVVSNERTTDSGETVSFGKETSETVTLTVVVPPENVQLADSWERGLNQLSATAEVTGDEEEPKTYSWSESGVLAKGDTVVLTATATGSEPFGYEWHHDGRKFEGETTGSLRLANVDDTVSGEYQVVVANDAGVKTSDPMTLEVKPAGTITELAGSVTVVEGESLEFDITVAGNEPLTYEWTKDGAVIDGATTTGYVVDNVNQEALGEYKLTVKREDAVLGYAAITVDLAKPPVIVTQPGNVSANLDEAVTFEVVAEGAELMTYEWYHNGAVVGDQSFLQLTNVQAADAGDYHVVVSNIAGEVTSDTVTLELVLPLEITQLTQSKEGTAVDLSAMAEVTGDEEEPTTYQWSQGGALLEGDNVTLTVTVTGTEPITYQWYHGEELVEGGTESTLRLTDVQGVDSGDYYVMVSNQLGTEYSEVITLSVVPINDLSVVSLNTVVNDYSVPTEDLADGEITLPVTDASAFSEGDQIMIIQMQHTSSAGTYEFRTVKSIANNDITVNASLTNSYYQSTSSKAQIVRIPQYTDVSVHSGGSITAAAWDGNTGGILAFNASGKVTVDSGGSIDVSGLGFRGAPKHTRGYVWQDGYSGEGYRGGYDSFGSGSGDQGGSGGIAGAPAHGNAGGGGGGGNGTAGDGGHTADNVTYGKVTSALGGSAVGSDSLSQIFLGGGGGSGGFHDTSGYTGPAGNGGGIIYITAASITLNGTIEANGGDAVAFSGSSSGKYKGGSGGGAGGTIYLKADNAASSADIHANGGSGSDGYINSDGSYKSCTAATQRGGNGGAGRIKVEDGAPTDPHPVVPTAVTELAGSINVVEGEDVELSVTAVGNESLTYQWSKGEKVIEGATAPALDLGNVEASAEADYKLAINNAEGLAGSVVITVVLADPPVIETQPQGGSANQGESFTFEAVAEGTEPMTYEWVHNGAMAGEQSSLQLPGVQAEDAGDYHVVVSNIAGEVTSQTVTLTVNLPPEIAGLTKIKEGPAVDLSAMAEVSGEEEEPTIYQWSKEGAIFEGDNVELTVTLTGSEPFSYQWYHGEELVEDGTASTLPLTDVQGEDSGDYRVVVSNELGTKFSEAITLAVVPPPAVTELVETINVVEGDGVELSVEAGGEESLTYHWSKGDEVIKGATAPSLDLGNVKASGEADYKLSISNAGELVGLVVITIDLADPPIIVTQPQGGTADLAETFTFEVVAEGNGLEYQWHKGSTSKVLNEFEANWDDGEAVEGTSIAGATQVKDGSLHLTEAANGKSGGFTVSDFTDGEIFNNFEISFRLYMTDSTCCGNRDDNLASHRPADGLSISIGSDLPDTIRLAEEGAGEGIRICFDTWDGGGGEAPAIDVWRGNDGDGPTVYIPFDDTAGNRAVGLVGNLNATYGNGPELGVPALNPNGVGTAVRFDGSKDQALRVKNHPDINITRGPWEERTWEFWFKAEKLPAAGQHQVLYEEGAHVRGISIYLTGTDNETEADLYMMAWNRAETRWGGKLNQRGGEGISAVKTPINVGEVYHLVFVMDGDPSGNMEGTLTGYLNGKKIGEVSGVHLLYNHSGNIAFGNKWGTTVTHEGNSWGSGGMGFNGVIDDAAFYSIALSEEQVVDHFEAFGAQHIWPGGMVARQNFNGVTSAPEEAKFKNANGDYVWMWTQGEWADVKVSVLDGHLKINFKGHEVISQELPIGWKPLKGPEWLFAARTGGANQTHWIDDLKIKVYADAVSTANSALVAGATGSSLPLTDLVGEDAGDYYVVVSNIAGEVTSDTATLAVDLPPTVTQLSASSNAVGLDLSATVEVAGEEPLTYEWSQNGSFLEEGDIEIVANVTGTEPISYQWYHDEQPVDISAANILRLAKAGVDVSGDYYVEASNRLATVTSDTMALVVKPSTTITELAGSLSVYEGETIDLSVTASGMTPLTYQWSLGGTEIDGATSSMLSLDKLEAAAAGDYKLAIRHEDGLVGEVVISVVVPGARILTQPVGDSVDIGGSHTFEVVADGIEPIGYKWYHAGTLLEEATESTLILEGLTGEDAGDYYVEVSNETLPWGVMETSAKANLMVLIPLAITHLTESKLEGEENWQWALQGGTIDLSVTADGTPPLNYQWTKDGEPIAGATGPGITLAGLEEEDVGLYTVKVSNATEQLESAPFKVVVLTATTAQPAKIVQQPKAVTATLGETAELSVSVEGSDPISYQWYYEGEPIEDGTERVLSIPDVQKADAGEYHVVVSNDGYPWGATETSDPAALTIESPPVITKLTESITVLRGDTIELSVTATGDEPISYQWNKGGTEVEGATGPKLILADASQSDTGDYTVTVSNAAGEVVSDAVSVTMPEPVRIVTQPQDVHAVVGESATMMVVVEGSAPIEYFWLFDGEWVEGGTESTLRLTNLQAADFGAYNVLVRNATGIEVSKPAMLTVMSPPEITQLSQSLTLIEGESVELTVTADGDEPLAYQWSWGGEAIEGATASRLSLDEVTASDAGDYSVTIGNAAGQAESGIVTVKVVAPIRIVTQPEGAAAIVGDTVTLQVVAEGTEPIRYYWYHDGELVDGATESTLRLAKSQETDSGSYNVIVQNQGGTAISEIAELIVLMPPEITQLTESLTVIEGESVELTVAALGSEPLAYQWSRGGEAIVGATAPTLRLAKVAPTDAGDYSVIVSNTAGEVESGIVTVKVIEPVRIVTQPEGATAILGESVTLQVVANGTAPITYAWYHDGELVEGATESTLRLAKVQAADSGVYHLVASNPGGTAKSKIAGLVVMLPPEITQLTESLSVMERDSAELSVTAVGSEPLAYQWSRDGVEIEGATAPTLPLVRVAPAAAGDYTVVARNAAGQAESNAITVEVIEPIRIVTQPEGANATLEDTVTLRVVAEGTEPINYFWLHNGRPVEGGRQSTLTLTELEAEDAGEYVVMVSNVGGQATTETAHLSVELPEGAYLVEDFDGLKLGPWSSGDDTVGDGTDWTATPPAGWTAERGAGHEPAAAVEFDGWTFLDPVSWHKTAGTEREQFTKGSGVIAVADSAHTGGESDAKFSATMATPAIDISGAQADSLVLTYDSSWREMQRKRVVAAFEEDFEGDDVGEGVTIAGTAVQALQFVRTGGAWPWLKLNGVLKLTDAVYSQNGGMLISDFSNGGAFNEFEISFRLFMGGGTRRPADGLSVSIGNDLPNLTYPAEEGVSDAAFRVCFDAWDSGGGEAPAIEIFNGKKSVAIQKFHGQTGAADSEKFVNEEGEFVMMWHKTEWTDVKIRVVDGLATVHFRGHDVIRDVPIDLAPIEAAQFMFAARTGGAHQKHYIDDIRIRLFDSSRSRVTVAYDGGEPVTLLELDTQTPSAYDETVSLPLNNPDGVQSAVITWDYHGLDNWWAVDNITVATDAEPEPTLAGLATNSGRYVIDEPITVQFNGGPGNPRDWIGIYRTYMTPGEHGSLAWMYVNGETTPGDGLPDGSVTFINNLSAGDYVVRYFKNDGYHEIADAAAFTVGPLPAVATGKTQYAPGESITVRFSDGPGNPSDWISLMPLGETSSIAWAYVGSSRIPGETLATGTVTFADGLPAGEYWVMFLTNDGYRQLAKAKVTVEGEIVPPPLGFANNGDGTITLTFEGRLQTAPTINGPWQDMDATSPVTLPTDQRQRFTRSVK